MVGGYLPQQRGVLALTLRKEADCRSYFKAECRETYLDASNMKERDDRENCKMRISLPRVMKMMYKGGGLDGLCMQHSWKG
jgi:hypothetical protein